MITIVISLTLRRQDQETRTPRIPWGTRKVTSSLPFILRQALAVSLALVEVTEQSLCLSLSAEIVDVSYSSLLCMDWLDLN